MNKLRDYAHLHIAEQPTEKGTAIPRFAPVLVGTWAEEAHALRQPGETPEALCIRLLLFYQHANRQESDTALCKALERVTGH